MSTSSERMRGFLRVLWMPLVAAIPVALFCGTLQWLGWLGYKIAYEFTLLFAYPIALVLWVTNTFLAPRFRPRAASRRNLWLHEVLPTTLSALVGALLGVVLLEAWQPGIIGSALGVVQVLMFTLYFGGLAMAVSHALAFHHDSVDRARTEEELRLARQLQRTIVGNDLPAGLPLDVHAVIDQSRQVSGDFYDVIPADGGACYLAIADVAGERMPAALLASMLLAALRMQAVGQTSVAEIVRNINTLACGGKITDENLFATMFVARFDPRTMNLSYTNAGHRYPAVFRGGREQARLIRGGTVVGALESAEYEQDSIMLQRGDRLLLFTDGASEAANRHGELFGEDRLCAPVRSAAAGRQSRAIAEELLAQVREFRGGVESQDDVTFMVVQV